MLSLLPTRKRMIGGLYFGPAGWQPMRFEPAEKPLAAATLRPAAAPTDDPALRQVQCGECLRPAAHDQAVDLHAPWCGTFDGRQVVRNESDRPIFPGPPDVKTLSDLTSLLQRAGIGATNPFIPPLLAQLHALKDGRARNIIINMLPQQPESMLPSGLTYLCMPEIVAGLMLLLRILPARRTIAALERHDHRTLHFWSRSLKRCRVTRVRLLNRYPQANPTVLARRLISRRLPVDMLPTRAGILMLDPVTLWALGRFIVSGSPLIERPIEIFSKNSAPRLILAPLGISIETLLAAHGMSADNQQIIVNGMLAGAQAQPEDLITPTTQMISVRPLPLHEMPSACIACGWCVDHCPTELNPIRLHDLSLQKAPLKADESFESLHCIGCGLCSYVCPTRLPLTQQIISLRTLARAEIKRLTGEENVYLPPPGEDA